MLTPLHLPLLLQDFRLSEIAANEGRAVVVVMNKWDQVDQEEWTQEAFVEDVKAQLRHVNWATVVCTSAHQGRIQGPPLAS